MYETIILPNLFFNGMNDLYLKIGSGFGIFFSNDSAVTSGWNSVFLPENLIEVIFIFHSDLFRNFFEREFRLKQKVLCPDHPFPFQQILKRSLEKFPDQMTGAGGG